MFREKIPVLLLKIWGNVLIDCRRNGFINPRVEGGDLVKGEYEGGKIVFQQIISTDDRPGDLCMLCDRDCKRREQIESGEMKKIRFFNKDNANWQEPKPCWARE